MMIFLLRLFLDLYHALTADRLRVTATREAVLGTLACAVMIVPRTVQGAVMEKLAKMFAGDGNKS